MKNARRKKKAEESEKIRTREAGKVEMKFRQEMKVINEGEQEIGQSRDSMSMSMSWRSRCMEGVQDQHYRDNVLP